MRTTLMVSVVNRSEARIALDAGAGIIDVKNPGEGALGAPSPSTLADITQELMGARPLSVALGEFPGKPGAAALAALGAVSFKPDYIKLAFLPQTTVEEIRATLTELRKTIPTALIAAAYADKVKQACWSLETLAQTAKDCGAQGVLVDTCTKDGTSLFEHLSEGEVRQFVRACKERGLLCALAGALEFKHIPLLRALEPDIVGTRSAVCGGDRVHGRVDAALVARFKVQLGGQAC